MKLGILSRKASLYSTRRLREAARERGHEARVVNYLRCTMNITARRPAVVLGEERLAFDAVVPRIGASATFYGTAVVRQFEMTGTFTANESQAVARSRDKLRALQLLSREGIDLPVTGFAHSVKDTAALLDLVGGPPVVVKLLEGTQGRGVILAETRKAAESVIDAFRQLDANILVQEFVADAGGEDLRVFVVDGEVVAAMVRRAAPGEFRANLHLGGTAEEAELSDEEREISVQAAECLGLGVCGVDLLRSGRGPLVLEVNSSPGLEGIESATGVDVAGAVVAYVERAVEAGASPRGRGAG